ncbi:DUF397 domain-containing protein [Embleya sp. NBC_00888]|nr:DUF397 domain-containing protein [Embleya sp. NBC_00888]
MGAHRALPWRKSSASTEVNCVETALATENVLVRDSKTADGRCVRVERTSWVSFLGVLRDSAEADRQQISQHIDTNGHNPKNHNGFRAGWQR